MEEFEMSRAKRITLQRFCLTALVTVLVVSLLASCTSGNQSGNNPPGEDLQVENLLTAEVKEATEHTRDRNAAIYMLLDFSDSAEFEFAQKGLLAAPEALELHNEDGDVIWSQKAFAFVEDADAPGSANPSLWRHTQINHSYGLFEVTEGIYQVRGYDISNITFIEGETGWIIFDPLTNVETAKAAFQLVSDTLGERPVMAVVYSHSHADHFGGVKGVISEEEVAEREIPIIAPDGFEEHAVSENIYAGTAMSRRAEYMYGKALEPGEQGRLAVGLGVGMPLGSSSYISPNDIIMKTGERRTIDGVTMEFQMTPGTEAPAEMNTWFPDMKAFWAAENCTGTLHNLYTLRGAQVRDGNAWALYIMEAITLYGQDMEVVFQSHNWPHWENEVIMQYLTNTAAMYKFINDQTLMYINQGYTSDEISNMITLPSDLEKVWYTRQYYGTVAHNSKAVYQRFMGWYDANPAHLNPLTPTDSAKKTVEYMGGADAVLERAKADFDKGEYQWVAEVTTILVFADPTNQQARYLCADAFEQLGYQAEAGTWRSIYLTGARELREGGPLQIPSFAGSGGGDMLRAMPPYMVFDYLGIKLDSNLAQDLNLRINVVVIDDAPYLLTIRAGVLLYQKGTIAEDAAATITLPREAVAILFSPDAADNEYVEIEGDANIIKTLYGYMAEFDPHFNIIEP